MNIAQKVTLRLYLILLQQMIIDQSGELSLEIEYKLGVEIQNVKTWFKVVFRCSRFARAGGANMFQLLLYTCLI